MTAFTISEIFKEARRRRVFRVAALYLIGAWVFLQISDLAFPAFGIPDIAIRYVWLGVIFAFPIAILLGWRYDMVGGRIVRTPQVSGNIELSLQRPDYIILASLTVVVFAIAIGLGGRISELQPSVRDSSWADSVESASIAVMPFVNMSPDPNNSYLADGISEELLNGLAQVSGLRVPARTSSFSLRDKNLDIRQIGEKLNVAFVLEGSIRIAGDKLRITAQLIDSRSDTHRWSETYERPSSDVFAVQDAIAENVVAAMKDILQLDTTSTRPVQITQNPEAYRYYLRARALIRNRETDESSIIKFDEAIGLLKTATEIDPAFSDGFVALADAYSEKGLVYEHLYSPSAAEKAYASAEGAARTALELEPQSSEALRAWGNIIDDDEQAEEAFRVAIEINSNNVEAYADLARILINKGDVDEGLDLARKYHRLDPLNMESARLIAEALLMKGSLREASTYFRINSELRAGIVGENEEPSQEYLDSIAELPSEPLNFDREPHLRMKLQPQCGEYFGLSFSNDAYTNGQSAYLYSLPESVGWCNSSGRASAEPFRGKYIRLVAMVKTRNVAENATLWMRIDGHKFAFSLGFDNGNPDFIETPNSDWRPYELRLYVPSDSYVISYGGVLFGTGEMWMDDFRFDVSDTPDFN